MATAQITAECSYCRSKRLFTKSGPSHVLHLILSVLTVGLWLPVWVIIVVLGALTPYRCQSCGKAKLR
jgi:DNA-directed RNA polymerase subunit RPC12/RpoP